MNFNFTFFLVIIFFWIFHEFELVLQTPREISVFEIVCGEVKESRFLLILIEFCTKDEGVQYRHVCYFYGTKEVVSMYVKSGSLLIRKIIPLKSSLLSSQIIRSSGPLSSVKRLLVFFTSSKTES